jgi:hypothetical protein
MLYFATKNRESFKRFAEVTKRRNGGRHASDARRTVRRLLGSWAVNFGFGWVALGKILSDLE